MARGAAMTGKANLLNRINKPHTIATPTNATAAALNTRGIIRRVSISYLSTRRPWRIKAVEEPNTLCKGTNFPMNKYITNVYVIAIGVSSYRNEKKVRIRIGPFS